MDTTIHWNNERRHLETSNGTILSLDRHKEFHGHPTELFDIKIEYLSDALDRAREDLGEPEMTLVLESSTPQENSRTHHDRDIYFFDVLDEREPQFTFSTSTLRRISKPHVLEEITPVVQQAGMEIRDIRIDDSTYEIVVSPTTTHTVGQCAKVGDTFCYLIRYGDSNPNTPIGAYWLATSGRFTAFLGEPESTWLEAKQKGYGLEDDGQKHELAIDLAAIANISTGGLIVIGLSTTKDDAGQDVIEGISGCKRGSLMPDKYVKVALHRIYPTIHGLDIRLIDHGDRHFMVLYVPAQPEHLLPFLVRGGVIHSSKVRGSAFTVPYRVGSTRGNMSPEVIHSLLSRGK